jgi:hypothetical protein
MGSRQAEGLAQEGPFSNQLKSMFLIRAERASTKIKITRTEGPLTKSRKKQGPKARQSTIGQLTRENLSLSLFSTI